MIKIDIAKQLQLAQGYTQLRINTTILPDAITAVYGSSGAGKTTLLKILAGLVQPEEGVIEINGVTWLNTARRICLPPQQRSIGFVFQDYALFPHMTVLQNLLYAADKNENKNDIQELLRLVKMEAFINVKPARLSGGQQQRIALARALVRKPQLLLLDEPLSALDDAMRSRLQTELYNIQQQLRTTTLLVSHNAAEVQSLAAYIIHLENGKIVFEGTPRQLFGAANRSSTLQFTGEVVQVKHIGAAYTVEVKAGNNLMYIKVDEKEAMNLKTGDKIEIFATTQNIAVQKIK